jgi:nitronate monooxygenase
MVTLRTRFTKLVGCRVPIQLAGMGAAATPELAAAVSNAGALGMLGTARPGLNPATLTAMLDELRLLTSNPFGVNFLVEPGYDTDPRCFALAAQAAKVVEFFYGEPDPDLVAIAHDGNALACWQVGSRTEAIAAQQAGCDFIVVQGLEAGGHIRGRISLLALLSEVKAAVDVPIVAAGGIGTGQQIADALAAGADGVRIGTRFLAAKESGAHRRYVEALIAARAEDTVITEAFSVGWPDAPHRVLSSCVAAAEAISTDVIGERSSLDGSRVPARRLSPLVADRTTNGAIHAMPLWAGVGVDAVTTVQAAQDIVQELVGEARLGIRSQAQQQRTRGHPGSG